MSVLILYKFKEATCFGKTFTQLLGKVISSITSGIFDNSDLSVFSSKLPVAVFLQSIQPLNSTCIRFSLVRPLDCSFPRTLLCRTLVAILVEQVRHRYSSSNLPLKTLPSVSKIQAPEYSVSSEYPTAFEHMRQHHQNR